MAADWIKVGGEAQFAPLNVLELVESRWGGHNQQVTEANVRSIDMANGGPSRGRLASSTPPNFRPVAQYEAGRTQMIADSDNMTRTPRFGGFLRGFFGR
jgi:hypothetical protein